MARKKKRMGVGARCSVLVKRLHPQNVVVARIPNSTAQERLEDLVVTKRDEVTRKGRTFEAIFFDHPTFPNEPLWACQRFAVVKQEGDPLGFFENNTSMPSAS